MAQVDPSGTVIAAVRLSDHPKENMHPEYWEAKGYSGNWGDASVNSPWMRIMRKEAEVAKGQGSLAVQYVILCAILDAPVTIYVNTQSWGSY